MLVDHIADVADEAGVEDRIHGVAVVARALGQALDPRARGGGEVRHSWLPGRGCILAAECGGLASHTSAASTRNSQAESQNKSRVESMRACDSSDWSSRAS